MDRAFLSALRALLVSTQQCFHQITPAEGAERVFQQQWADTEQVLAVIDHLTAAQDSHGWDE